ncbi:transposase [Frankia sp. CiP1_Cm_nod2]
MRTAPRARSWDRRLLLDAIFYLLRGGIAWQALPAAEEDQGS